jgi:hypothetical protein
LNTARSFFKNFVLNEIPNNIAKDKILDFFISHLFVWGYHTEEIHKYCFDENEDNINIEYANYKAVPIIIPMYVKQMQNSLDKINSSETYLIKNVNVFINFLSKINLQYFKFFFSKPIYTDEEILNFNYDHNFEAIHNFEIKSEIKFNLIQKVGYLLHVNCGHNGMFNNKELSILHSFLTYIKFDK